MSDTPDKLKLRWNRVFPTPEILKGHCDFANEYAVISRNEVFARQWIVEWEGGRMARVFRELPDKTVRLTPHRPFTLNFAIGLHPLKPVDVAEVHERDHKHTIEEGIAAVKAIVAGCKQFASTTASGPIQNSKTTGERENDELKALIPFLRRVLPADYEKLGIAIVEPPDRKWVRIHLDGIAMMIPLTPMLDGGRCFWVWA